MTDILESEMTTANLDSTGDKTRIKRVGVVGLGHMGHAFAMNLIDDGYQMTVYDRDPKRAATVTNAPPRKSTALPAPRSR